MNLDLQPAEVRVLGSLIEKEITTPEYYPLSLNALINACNQKSNRDPVVFYDEETVLGALDSLRARGLTSVITGAGSRVAKYSHRLTEKLNLGRRETAILCELMLRGPQTGGELRNRTERMHRFDDLSEVESLLERMSDWITRLPRRPGEKENRYAQLLSGPVDVTEQEWQGAAASAPVQRDRLAQLEIEVSQLRAEVDDLRKQFSEFRKAFE
ncbi:MAG: YceH family protein [Acidobacteriaceae bacterium]|nr:YceH family protein [Acidobacteriaceae bacterium]